MHSKTLEHYGELDITPLIVLLAKSFETVFEDDDLNFPLLVI